MRPPRRPTPAWLPDPAPACLPCLPDRQAGQPGGRQVSGRQVALVIGAPVAQLVRAVTFLGATRWNTEIGAALLGATITEVPTGAADDMAALVVPPDAPDWDTIRHALKTVGLDVTIQPVTAPD